MALAVKGRNTVRAVTFLVTAVIVLPASAFAQGVTQSRDGLATASQGHGITNNAAPAGSVNAATGPQSRPAYPSGSTTANPGAAFVKTMPKPQTGPAAAPPGVISTKPLGTAAPAQAAHSGVGQAAVPPK